MTNEATTAIILSPREVATGDPAGAALENIITDVLGDGAICYVSSGPGKGQWQLDKDAAETANGTTIVEPISGPGRWFLKVAPGALGAAATNYQTGTSYQFVFADSTRKVSFDNAAPVAVTVPDDSTVDFPVDTEIPVYQAGAGQVTFAGESAATIESADSLLSLRTQGSAGTLWKRGVNDWVLIGDLA